MISPNTDSLLNAPWENILDRYYTTVRNAIPCAALGHSDHVMVHLIRAYRQKLKICKPVVMTTSSGPVKLRRIFRHAS